MPQPIFNRKKIAYVITKSNWGGAQRYVYDLATNVPKNTFDVIVVCGGNGTLAKKLEQEGTRVIRIKGLERDIRFGSEIRVLYRLKHLFAQEQPDIVHLNSSKIGGLGSLAARMARVPHIIFTAHGFAFNEKRNIVWKPGADWQPMVKRLKI